MPEKRKTNFGKLIAIGLCVLILPVGLLTAYLSQRNSQGPQLVESTVIQTEPVNADTGPAADATEVVEEEQAYTRLDVGNLVLIKQKTPHSSLDEIDGIFGNEYPIVIAKCYSVDACLKARLIMEPLAADSVFQQTFYTVIIEAFDASEPPKPGYEGIVYMFSLPNCGMDMGGKEYTSTSLAESANQWHEALSKSCEASKNQ